METGKNKSDSIHKYRQTNENHQTVLHILAKATLNRQNKKKTLLPKYITGLGNISALRGL